MEISEIINFETKTARCKCNKNSSNEEAQKYYERLMNAIKYHTDRLERNGWINLDYFSDKK